MLISTKPLLQKRLKLILRILRMETSTRRILKAGKHSLAVTLPLGWLRFVGLKAGDVVEVLSGDDGVVIRPLEAKNEK